MTLGDFFSDPDPCGLILPLEPLAGQGVAFGVRTGNRLLGDAEFLASRVAPVSFICEGGDGAQDYSLALGTCAMADPLEGTPFISLGSAGDAIPGPICVRSIFDITIGFDTAVLSADAGQAVMQVLRSNSAYQDTALPETLTLSGLISGQRYELEITTTDGNTPEVSDRKEFLYQGEMVIRFLSP